MTLTKKEEVWLRVYTSYLKANADNEEITRRRLDSDAADVAARGVSAFLGAFPQYEEGEEDADGDSEHPQGSPWSNEDPRAVLFQKGVVSPGGGIVVSTLESTVVSKSCFTTAAGVAIAFRDRIVFSSTDDATFYNIERDQMWMPSWFWIALPLGEK